MTALLILGLAVCAFAATMIGGLFALTLKKALPLVMAFSAGAVIGVAFFDLAPEALAAANNLYDVRTLLLLTAGGFFGYALLDQTIAHHSCGHAHPVRGVLGAASFSAHSVIDGFAMGVSFQVSHAIGIVVAAAVLTHDFADGLNTVNVVTHNGGTRAFALRWLVIDAAAPIVGAAFSLVIAPSSTMLAILLAVFCGAFLNIGASELLPESHRARPRISTALMTIAGAAFLYGVTTLVR
jgi:ZIP family zinc transporter